MAAVTCLGVLVADLVARPVTAYPERGKLVQVDEIRLATGGGAANTAVVLQKLGVPTAIIGRVGADDLGDFVMASLAGKGVDVSGIHRDDEKSTGSSIVLTAPDGERSFISKLGANAAVCAEDIDWPQLGNSQILHIGYAMVLPSFDGAPAAAVLQKTKEMGITTSVDTGWDPSGRWWESLAPYLPYTDIFLPSLAEAEMLTGKQDYREMARVFLEAGAGVVALKLGEQGSYICTRATEFLVPPFNVACVDATGAGDAFAAGFLAGWLKGLSLEETARLANATGALATTAVGATAGVTGWEQVQALARNSKMTN
ncbi:sugar kinase [Moorella naiadis]|uniref:carbohydrate kinase family protein n=1 Tax=Moorella naiadis (nom. illeg.) TaxID=3093670 RepID=UPI003D9CABAC